MYAADTDWAFASERPLREDADLGQCLFAEGGAARKARFIKVIGWHTFRHTYSTMLSDTEMT